MPVTLPSARHQAALTLPTGYRRRMLFTFSRDGVTRVLEPTGGTLTQDARRSGRWDGSLSFSGNDVLPRRPGDLLTPFGTRVTVELGLELIDGTISRVPYGVYEVTSSRIKRGAGDRTVDVSLGDLSGPIDRYRFETPAPSNGGADLATVTNRLVINRTGVNPNVSPTGVNMPSRRIFGLETDTGPWGELLDVLDAGSRTGWFDRTGKIQLGSTVPDISTAYPLNPLASISSDFDTQPPNVIVARGESQDDTPPVQAVAMDTDPTSATYAGTGPGTSPYGRVTQYYSSPLITTVSAAQSAANTILSRTLGAGATHAATIPYDPTITAGDVVTSDGVVYVVDAVSINLTGDTSLALREI